METNPNSNPLLQSKNVLIGLGIIALTVIILVSITREKIVNDDNREVSVTGQGKVSTQPDTANISVGVQIDKAPTSEEALKQLNEKMTKLIAAVEALGIQREQIQTQNYSLYPQYDYKDGISSQSGFNANQQVTVKVKDIQKNPELVQKVVEAAGASGSNQISGVSFSVGDLNELKQQARILAIEDAKKKSSGLAQATGVKLGKITGWYENVIQSPEPMYREQALGMGGDAVAAKEISAVRADIPSGSQDIIVEMNVNYEIE